jgi:hypothetical protein
MTVLRLVQSSNKDTVAVLKGLLAEAMDGDIRGLAVYYQTTQGVEEAAFTGLYGTRPAEAANAAMRLCWKLTQAQDANAAAPGRPFSR